MIKKQKIKKALLATVLFTTSTALLNGCAAQAQREAYARKVITALPTEVAGCTFIGVVDSPARMAAANARFDLLAEAGKMGATHVVETYMYPLTLNKFSLEVGIALSGRAYICPEGLGPKVSSPKSHVNMAVDIPSPTNQIN